MRVLLDTCAISEIARQDGSQQVRTVVDAIDDDDLFLSVISVGEITKGIGLLEPGKRRSAFEIWLAGLRSDYAERVLPVDAAIASLWGELTAKARRNGRIVGVADGLIAATALRHGLHVATRNVSDFEPTGALILNPWD